MLETDDKIGFLDANGFQQTGYVTRVDSENSVVVEHKHTGAPYSLRRDESRSSWVESRAGE